ncbi:hypothetical protein C2G38_2231204 [Gigaspora rosea]|uniref:Reverse transcriptase domain-containing protein n=1 Tax=Gigaspora rosea TaxID=44941 RepID=A0A397TX25_9GLOM|nr:hypothetical protein C2G38_2231204 [Gigaspora rosea]
MGNRCNYRSRKYGKVPSYGQYRPKEDRVEGMNDLGNSYKNGIRIEKYEPKTFNNYQKPTDTGHTSIIAGKNKPKSHVSRPNILPARYHKRYDEVKGCTKSESNGTEGKEGKPTEVNRKYDMAGESYKNYSEVDGTCRVWMMKVENIRAKNFFNINNIKINSNKSELIVINSSIKKANSQKKNKIQMGGATIQAKEKEKATRYLGIWLSEQKGKECYSEIGKREVQQVTKAI